MNPITAWLLLLTSLLTNNIDSAFAQADTTKLICPVEIIPELISGGGPAAITQAVRQHLIYPPEAKRAHAVGRVFVSCTITADGFVREVHVVKGFRPDCDSAAVRAVQKLPRFKLGQQFGKPVACGLTLPVQFGQRASKQRMK